MSTRQQRRANRRNAPNSNPVTGLSLSPASLPPGNGAFKSGLDAASQTVIGESPEEFAQLQAHYFEEFAPAIVEQRFLVDQVIRNEWLLRRYHRVEAQLWTYQTRLCDQDAGVPLGEAFSKAGATFRHLHRLIQAVQKARTEAMRELKRLQTPWVPAEIKGPTEELASFLPSAPDAPAAEAVPSQVSRDELHLRDCGARGQLCHGERGLGDIFRLEGLG
ncbi:MAG: hypothetical protein P4L56_03805 [Candidatus Sulfopaludibacter sp.]|nr:hypothetical protein [Candidatus Sulfopaludibacter sp.]